MTSILFGIALFSLSITIFIHVLTERNTTKQIQERLIILELMIKELARAAYYSQKDLIDTKEIITETKEVIHEQNT